jgi:DNA polymerase zeta
VTRINTQGTRGKASSQKSISFYLTFPPPSKRDLFATLEQKGLPGRVYIPPFYSSEDDAPRLRATFGGLTYDLRKGNGYSSLHPWISVGKSYILPRYAGCLLLRNEWEYAACPPTQQIVKRWISRQKLKPHSKSSSTRKKTTSQVVS